MQKQYSIPKLKKRLEEAFNAYIRKRDLVNGYGKCISCGKMVLPGSSWHAGHYFPVSTVYASLRYNEKNVNGQCNECNTFLEGNKQGYRAGLIKKYGEGVLDELDLKRSLPNVKWGPFEYLALIQLYKKKVKEMM